jgi:hypothetical protein
MFDNDDITETFVFDTTDIGIQSSKHGDMDSNGFYLTLEGKPTKFKWIRSHEDLSYTLVEHTTTKHQKWLDNYKIRNESIDIVFYDADPIFKPQSIT